MVARYLERKGIPTICLGSAYDIFKKARPPRAVFLNYPLGHSSGKPFDKDNQEKVIYEALIQAQKLSFPNQIISLQHQWDNTGWQGIESARNNDDTRQPRSKEPQYQEEADRDAAIEK